MIFLNSNLSLSSIVTGFPECILSGNFKPVLLISGNYNIFDSGFDTKGSYMCSGLYISDSFKLPIYIGGTETMQDRIENKHIHKLENDKHKNNPFQFSWNEHISKEGFVWWLLEVSVNEDSKITEQRWLNYYRPFADEKGGFNIAHDAVGAMKGRKMSDITKQKLSKIRKEKYSGENHPFFGKHHTEEYKTESSNNKKGKFIGKDSHRFGVIVTEETKQKIREKRKSQDMSFCEKSIKQIDKNSDEVIKIWKSTEEAAKFFNTNSRTIRKVLRGKGKTCCNYRWEYVNPKNNNFISNIKKTKKVKQINFQTNEIIKIWYCIANAARSLKTNNKNICSIAGEIKKSCLNGKIIYGFKWEYVENQISPEISKNP